MSGTLRGEIWGLSFAVAHSDYEKFVLFLIEYRDVAKTALFKPSIPFDIEFQFCDITCYRHDH